MRLYFTLFLYLVFLITCGNVDNSNKEVGFDIKAKVYDVAGKPIPKGRVLITYLKNDESSEGGMYQDGYLEEYFNPNADGQKLANNRALGKSHRSEYNEMDSLVIEIFTDSLTYIVRTTIIEAQNSDSFIALSN